MRTRLLPAAIAAFFLAGPALADPPDSVQHRFSDDLYAAGEDILVGGAGLQHVYAGGRTVAVKAEVSRSVHAAGRNVTIAGAVGDNAYAAGYRVELAGKVGGDAMAAGYRVELSESGAVAGDLTAAARRVLVRGPVGGDASLAGEIVEIAAPIGGSVQIRAEQIRFVDGARIDGTLVLWSEQPIEVPASVAPADRVQTHKVEAPEPAAPSVMPKLLLAGGGAILFVLVALAAGLAWAAPSGLEQARLAVRDRPGRTTLVGLIALAALLGSVPVAAITLVGLLLLPVLAIVVPVLLALGYLTGAYGVGRTVIALTGADPRPGRLVAFAGIVLGIIVLALLQLIPLIGWWLGLVVLVAGLGAWFARWLGNLRAAA